MTAKTYCCWKSALFAVLKYDIYDFIPLIASLIVVDVLVHSTKHFILIVRQKTEEKFCW